MVAATETSWAEAPLGDLAEIVREGAAPEQITSGTKYVGLEHIDNEGHIVAAPTVSNGELASNKFRFGPRHILYGKLRPYLRKTARPDFAGVCSTDILPILAGPRVDRDYLYHYLRHPRVVEFATSRCEGANLPRLSPKQLAVLPIPIPFSDDVRRSLAEQKRIAAILDKADVLRRKRGDADRCAADLAPSLFHGMFSQWLRMPTSEMPRLGNPEMADIASGVTKGRHFNGQATVIVPYIRVANVQDGFLDLTEIKTIEALPSDVEALRLQRGDVLMTEGGDFDKLGRGAMWEADIPDCIHQNHVFRVRCNRRKLHPVYFAHFIRTQLAKGYFLSCAKKTSNLASMNLTQLKGTPVACPPMPLQERFAAEMVKLDDLRRTQSASAEASDDLFNSLVQRAFRGEL